MEIYSTLTRSKEDFVTINKNRVNLFVCGPTVYDDAHIDDEMYEGIVSTPDSKIKMYIIPTNEELEIANETMELVK